MKNIPCSNYNTRRRCRTHIRVWDRIRYSIINWSMSVFLQQRTFQNRGLHQDCIKGHRRFKPVQTASRLHQGPPPFQTSPDCIETASRATAVSNQSRLHRDCIKGHRRFKPVQTASRLHQGPPPFQTSPDCIETASRATAVSNQSTINVRRPELVLSAVYCDLNKQHDVQLHEASGPDRRDVHRTGPAAVQAAQPDGLWLTRPSQRQVPWPRLHDRMSPARLAFRFGRTQVFSRKDVEQRAGLRPGILVRATVRIEAGRDTRA